MSYAFEPVSTPEIVEAQRGNNNCIQKFLSSLRTDAKLSETTVDKYELLLNSIFQNIYVPICSVTESLLNKTFSDVYRERNFSTTYTSTCCSILNRFMIWSKNNMYTNISISVKNPETGKVIFTRDSSNHVEVTEHRKASNTCIQSKPKPVKNILETTEKSCNTQVKNIYDVRNVAILSLLRKTNLTPEEIETLDIYDFIHQRVTFQAHGHRSMMRIIPIDIETRNNIYQYLMLRTDDNDALFMSEERQNERIKVYEIKKVSVL